MASSESTGWRNFREEVESTGQYVMKVRWNCARGSLILYAKESLKSNQITALAALMESVRIHLCGTQNRTDRNPGPQQGEYSAGSISLTAQSGQQH